MRKGGVHMLKSSKVFSVSSFMRVVESRDKGFVLDPILLFTIVNFFSGRFLPKFFTVTSLFHWFS